MYGIGTPIMVLRGSVSLNLSFTKRLFIRDTFAAINQSLINQSIDQ